MPGKDTKADLPSTLKRSSDKAQRTWLKAHNSAVEEYGDEERANRVAYAALKHTHEKVGDHWEAKDESGPSDERAAKGRPDRAGDAGTTHGGVDASKSKEDLYEQAQRLDVEGRSRMDKDELVEALEKANERETRRTRQG